MLGAERWKGEVATRLGGNADSRRVTRHRIRMHWTSRDGINNDEEKLLTRLQGFSGIVRALRIGESMCEAGCRK